MDGVNGDPRVSEALGELHQYLSDALAPLVVADSIALLTTLPPRVVADEIHVWTSGQYRRMGASVPLSDYLYHAVRKLHMMGDFKLVPKEPLARLLAELKRLVLEFCPPQDRPMLAENLTRLGELQAVTASPAPFLHHLSLDAAHGDAGGASAEKAVAHGGLRFARLMEQLERMSPPPVGAPPEGGTSDLQSRMVTLAARNARDQEQFAEYAESLRSLGVDASMAQILRSLGRQLPAWTLPSVPSAGAAEAPLTPTAEAIRKIVTVERDPQESSRRFQDLVTVAIEQCNEGSLPRAVTMLDLASLMISQKKIDPAYVQHFLERAHDGLDQANLRKLADDPASHELLRRVLTFFPAFGAESLFEALRFEEKRERRRLLLALLETHGESARSQALERLAGSVATFGDSDAHFQRNLIYLVRRIPKPADVPLEPEVQMAVRLSTLGHPLLLVKEAIAYLGQVKNERSERALIARVGDLEAALLRPAESVHDPAELVPVLDRTVFTLVRLGTQGALRAVVDHGIKRQAQLGDTAARLAGLAAVDLSGDPVAVDRLVKAIRAARPHKLLGIVVPGQEKHLVGLIEAAAGTSAAPVREVLTEIAERFPTQKCGEAAGKALSAGPAPPPPREEPKSASLAGDLELFGLPTLLQNLAQSALTGVLTITDPVGDLVARITLEGGKLRACTVGHLEGEAAIYQLFERPTSGSFAFVDLRGALPQHEAQHPPQELVPLFFEGTRRFDELQQAIALVPDYATLKSTAVTPTTPQDEHDEGLARTVWARICSGAAALACEDGLPVDTYRIRRLLAHWLGEGALEPRPDAPGGA